MKCLLNLVIGLILFTALAGYQPKLLNGYFLPQVFAVLTFALIIGVLGRSATEKVIILGIASLAISVGLLVQAPTYQASPFIILLIGAVFLAIGTAGQSETNKDFIKKAIVFTGMVQAGLVFFQLVFPNQEALNYKNGIPVGTVGNSDFLAGVIGVSLLLLMDLGKRTRLRIVMCALLLLAIAFTKSKGTFGLVCFFIAYRFRPKTSMTLAIILILAAPLVLQQRLYGRLHLWQVAWEGIKENPIWGHGFGSFPTVYFNTVGEMMKDTNFKEKFGPWISDAGEAHNIFLQFMVEWGVVGFFLVVALFFVTYRASKGAENGLSMALALVAIKSIYTVVLGSTQGAVLWGILIGLAWKPTQNIFTNYAVRIFQNAVVCILMTFQMFNLRAESLLFQGMSALRIELLGVAKKHIDAGLLLDSNNTDLLLAKAFRQARANECENALTTVNIILEIRREMDTYKRGGHILFECKKYREAKKIFLDLHRVFPEHRTTMMKLAWINYHESRPLGAKYWAEKVLQSNPRRDSYSDEQNLREAATILKLVSKSPN